MSHRCVWLTPFILVERELPEKIFSHKNNVVQLHRGENDTKIYDKEM
jgi:hypothetical protein